MAISEIKGDDHEVEACLKSLVGGIGGGVAGMALGLTWPVTVPLVTLSLTKRAIS